MPELRRWQLLFDRFRYRRGAASDMRRWLHAIKAAGGLR
jgi:hypothetical protein